MMDLIAEHIATWTAAEIPKANGGRGRGRGANGQSPHGIKKLRELILELAVRGKLVPQDPNDETASVLLEKIGKEKVRLIKEGKIKKQKIIHDITENEKPFELPKEWLWTTLGSLINPLRPLTYGVLKPGPDTSDGVPLIKTENVFFREVLSVFNSRISKELDDQYKRTRLEGGEILLTLVGSIGRCAIAPSELKGANLSRSVGLVVPVGELSKDYIVISLFTLINDNYIKNNCAGTAQQVLNIGTISNLPVPLPPLVEQHRIVAKVDELMALCDKLEQQQTDSNDTHQTLVETLLVTLTTVADPAEFAVSWQRIAAHFDTLFTTEESIDQLKQTILQLAVMGKLVPQNPNDEPASILLEKIAQKKELLFEEEGLRTKAGISIAQEEEYITRRNGWEYCRLGNLAKFIDYRGRTPKKIESGVPLITAKNVRLGFISREPQEFISDDEYEKWMTRGFPKIGDILFTTEAPLGNVAVVDIDEKFALAQRVICFQLHNHEISTFLTILIMSKNFQEQLADNATGMTATGIKSAKLKEIPVPIPPLAEQHRIVAKVDELMTLCDTLKERLHEAQTTQVQLADAIVEQAVV